MVIIGYNYTMNTMRRRHYHRWSADEVAELRNEYTVSELTVQEIADLHDRSIFSILNRLEKDKLIDSRWTKPRGYQDFPDDIKPYISCEDPTTNVRVDYDAEEYLHSDSDSDNDSGSGSGSDSSTSSDTNNQTGHPYNLEVVAMQKMGFYVIRGLVFVMFFCIQYYHYCRQKLMGM
jgi:CCR4-NOT transcriptional regulation complex NOT5 subunit